MNRLPTIAALYALHGVAWCAYRITEGAARLVELASITVGKITDMPDLWFEGDCWVQTCTGCGGTGSEGSGPEPCHECGGAHDDRYSLSELTELAREMRENGERSWVAVAALLEIAA